MKPVLSIAVALLFIGVVSADYQDIPVGKCVIPLDLMGEVIDVAPADTEVNDIVLTDMTLLLNEGTKSAGFLYIFDFTEPYEVANLEYALNKAMNTLCARVQVDPYKDGFIATGLFKKGGQKSWGISVPLNAKDGKATRTAMVIIAFKNEELNEQIAKSAKFDEIKCPETQ